MTDFLIDHARDVARSAADEIIERLQPLPSKMELESLERFGPRFLDGLSVSFQLLRDEIEAQIALRLIGRFRKRLLNQIDPLPVRTLEPEPDVDLPFDDEPDGVVLARE